MKRYFSLIVLLGLVMMMSGCVKMATKEFRPFVKTYHIRIGEVEVFKNPDILTSGIKDIGDSVDNEAFYYQELIKNYKSDLKTQLEENGFVVVDDPDYQDLVIKTKIGDKKAHWLGWTGVVPVFGHIICQVEVYQNDQKVLFFEKGRNTTVALRAGTQMRINVIPDIIAELKKRFT